MSSTVKKNVYLCTNLFKTSFFLDKVYKKVIVGKA